MLSMAVIRFVPSQGTWEDLFKILIKVCKLKEFTESIYVFLKITRTNLNTLLKGKERSDRAGLTAPLRTHIGEISQEILQGKYYQEFRSNTKKNLSY